MKRLLTPAFVGFAIVGLAACGSDGNAASSAQNLPAGGASAVSIATVQGIGQVLVDSNGLTLYTPDQESGGTITCAAACTAFWKPVAAAAAPTLSSGGPALSLISRPDGTKQVAVAGHPLYTFAPDRAGTATGDGAADAFDGHSFTWHAVKADGSLNTAMSTTPATTVPGGKGSGGGYGY